MGGVILGAVVSFAALVYGEYTLAAWLAAATIWRLTGLLGRYS